MENLIGCELVVVELASDWQGVAALWFQLLWVVVTVGPPEVTDELAAPRRKYPKVGTALAVALCLSD
jgi:hypothetical protein